LKNRQADCGWLGGWICGIHARVNGRYLQQFLRILVGLCLLVAGTVRGEQRANWRLFRTADGLRGSSVSAVSVSPRGNVWAKHSDVGEISILDGYTVYSVPSPGRDYYRIYESQTGQLWSLYSEGLLLYESGQWVQHPIAQIRDEVQAYPVRQIRFFPTG
jgi:hypothetical protein